MLVSSSLAGADSAPPFVPDANHEKAPPRCPENEDGTPEGQAEIRVSPKPLESRKNQC
jgi:hypothetical protein